MEYKKVTVVSHFGWLTLTAEISSEALETSYDYMMEWLKAEAAKLECERLIKTLEDRITSKLRSQALIGREIPGIEKDKKFLDDVRKFYGV